MWYNGSKEDVLSRLGTRPEAGLTQGEVEQRREKYGKNELAHKKEDSLFVRFLAQFQDYMVIILLIAAAVSFAVSLLNGEADFFDPIIILSIVVLNAMIGVFQESKAQKALEALQKMSAPTVTVLRGGEKQRMNADELVIGDIIYLETGDLVPADARLVEAVSLKCDEAALTGESMAVEKDANFFAEGEINIADAKNMVFSSSTITACPLDTSTSPRRKNACERTYSMSVSRSNFPVLGQSYIMQYVVQEFLCAL